VGDLTPHSLCQLSWRLPKGSRASEFRCPQHGTLYIPKLQSSRRGGTGTALFRRPTYAAKTNSLYLQESSSAIEARACVLGWENVHSAAAATLRLALANHPPERLCSRKPASLAMRSNSLGQHNGVGMDTISAASRDVEALGRWTICWKDHAASHLRRRNCINLNGRHVSGRWVKRVRSG